MPITVSIPKTLLAAGRARAEAIGMSFSAYMSKLLKRALERVGAGRER
jgi:predicted DNA binding CopG/RHH family protein